MKTPLVSVITPAYNAEKYLEDMLKSIANQDYPYIEHIVVDDGSNDNTPNILMIYESIYNLRYHSKTNEGQVATLNKCIDMCNGEIIVWINADDVLFYKSTITNIVKFFNENDVGVVYGHMAIIDGDSGLLKIQYTLPRLDLSHLLVAHYAPCICYRKYVIKDFKFDPRWDFVMDYEQCLRMAKSGVRFGCLNEIILGYRRHSSTKSLSKRADLLAETNMVKNIYNHTSRTKRAAILKLVNGVTLMLHKLYGVKTIYELSSTERSNIAFPIKIDSCPRLILNQVLPYIYL